MSKRKIILASLIAGLGVCALGGCATARADVDIRDYFNIPTEVQTNAYVGAELTLASVTATDAEAGLFDAVFRCHQLLSLAAATY